MVFINKKQIMYKVYHHMYEAVIRWLTQLLVPNFFFVTYNIHDFDILSWSRHTACIGFYTAKKLAASNLAFQASFMRFIGT